MAVEPEVPDAPDPRAPDPRPLLIWDGECGFCRRAALWLEGRVGPDRLRVVPYQEALAEDDPPPVTAEDCRRAVQLVQEPEGQAREPGEPPRRRVLEGAAAVFRALAMVPGYGLWCWWLYRMLPGFAPATEWIYRRVARNRHRIGPLLRLLAGPDPRPPTWVGARRLYVLMVGIALAAACGSAALQIRGLLGSDGVLPVVTAVAWEGDYLAGRGFLGLPTLFWFARSDGFLVGVAWAGALLAACAAAGLASRWTLLAAWAVYVSVVNVGGVFFDFQADRLLLEAVLLGALTVVPGGIGKAAWRREPSAVGAFLLRLLLFRVVFFSGLAKLMAGGVAWEGYDGLSVWLRVQPMPHGGSLLATALDGSVARALSAAVVWIELVAPWLVLLGPRRLRLVGGLAIISVQLGTAACGNVGFLPLVVCGLAMWAFDDRMLAAVRVRRLQPVERAPGPRRPWATHLRLALAALVVLLAGADQVRRFEGGVITVAVEPRRLAQDLHVGLGYAFGVGLGIERFGYALEVWDPEEGYRELPLPSLPDADGSASPYLGLGVPRLERQLALSARAVPEMRAQRAALPQWFTGAGLPGRGGLLLRLLEGRPEVWGLLGAAPPPEPRRIRVRCFQEKVGRGRRFVRSKLEPLVPAVVLEDGMVRPY